MSTTTQKFGQRVKLARLRRKLTLRDLAVKAGVSFSHISDIERANTQPSLTIAEKLESVLGSQIRNGVRKRRA